MEYLMNGINMGSTKNAYVKGYKIAAKTGTSQKRDKEGNLYIGSCAAFAPADDPQIAILIGIDEPSNGEYYGGGYFGAQNIPNLWGIPVCVSASITSGTVVVGAFKTCASVVTNGGVSVEAVNTNEDDFVKNLMTIRAEERLALAVRRPAGFKKLTKAAT